MVTDKFFDKLFVVELSTIAKWMTRLCLLTRNLSPDMFMIRSLGIA